MEAGELLARGYWLERAPLRVAANGQGALAAKGIEQTYG